jgi:NADPH:quinone reductase-like Zn-dependent oxidoreductase
MEAIVHSTYGPPDALELKDIDQPVVNDHAVLVRVRAAAVGKGDWLTVGACRTSPACGTGYPNQSTGFQASIWLGALRRSARA